MIDDIYEHNSYEHNDNSHYHNETIVINNMPNQFIFNFLALSLISISVITALCKGLPTVISKIKNAREISHLSEYIIERETEEEINVTVEICSICIESYMPREKTITLPCTHKFHSKCIKVWLEKESNCPLCRSSLEI